MLEDFFGETAEERAPAEMMRIPTIDIVDREQDILVRAEMPGIDKDKVQIEATSDSVMLRAEMKEEHEEKTNAYVRRERRLGSFQRVIPMPAEIKPAEVKAVYKDGVLEITLPKTEAAATRQPVKVTIE
ncbi:MAG TPA: Hsp20/alpha crystallin family protein [Armatimonadota bacterium]